MLNKKSDYRKVRCVYGERAFKHYTFLCTDDIFQTLSKGDFVLTDTNEEYKTCKVVDEDTAELDPRINYKHILKKL